MILTIRTSCLVAVLLALASCVSTGPKLSFIGKPMVDAPVQVAAAEEGTVVLLHGLRGSAWNMKLYANIFAQDSMRVVNWGYPSREKNIVEHAHDLVQQLKRLAAQRPGENIHFVAHSMGALVLRAAVNHPECPSEARLSRVVLLAPPNNGAAWGRYLGKFKLVNKLTKDKAEAELMREQNFDHLGFFPLPMQVLVIAGTWNFNPIIEGENDGVVAVSETFLSTPHCHATLNTGHKTILMNKESLELTKKFIQNKNIGCV